MNILKLCNFVRLPQVCAWIGHSTSMYKLFWVVKSGKQHTVRVKCRVRVGSYANPEKPQVTRGTAQCNLRSAWQPFRIFRLQEDGLRWLAKKLDVPERRHGLGRSCFFSKQKLVLVLVSAVFDFDCLTGLSSSAEGQPSAFSLFIPSWVRIMQGALSSHFQRSPRFWISFARMLRDGIGVSDAQRWLAGWRAPANGKKNGFFFFLRCSLRMCRGGLQTSCSSPIKGPILPPANRGTRNLRNFMPPGIRSASQLRSFLRTLLNPQKMNLKCCKTSPLIKSKKRFLRGNWRVRH